MRIFLIWKKKRFQQEKEIKHSKSRTFMTHMQVEYQACWIMRVPSHRFLLTGHNHCAVGDGAARRLNSLTPACSCSYEAWGMTYPGGPSALTFPRIKFSGIVFQPVRERRTEKLNCPDPNAEQLRPTLTPFPRPSPLRSVRDGWPLPPARIATPNPPARAH